MGRIYNNLTELVGRTPLVELHKIEQSEGLKARLVVKIEYFNPGGSVKDRIALAMIEDAERKGVLKSGSTIIEPTSGNTGIGLAWVAAIKGYPLTLTMPDTMSIERRKLLKALGANLVLTPGKDGMKGAIAKARQLHSETPDSFIPSQFENPANPTVHRSTTAAVKALTDVVVTSSNARKVIESFDKDEKIIFGPDKNLGEYICSVTGRKMLLWNGGCHVHQRFSLESILFLKRSHPAAKILAHPECPAPIQKVADVVASTAGLLRYATESSDREFIVATESVILHKMKEQCPQKTFIPAPPEFTEGVGCSCNECAFMKLNTLPKLYNTLKYEWPTIEIPAKLAGKALRPIMKMLEISKCE